MIPLPRTARSALLCVPLVCLSFGSAHSGGAPKAVRPGTESAVPSAQVSRSSSEAPTPPDRTLDRAASLYLGLARLHSPEDGYPRSVRGGEWNLVRPRAWTSGFFPGILWQLYDVTGESALLEEARRWTDPLEGQRFAPSHDVGFVILLSFGRGYEATGDESYRDVALEAAQHLAGRFDPDVGAIRSWDGSRRFAYPVVIDGMMNLELLFWAAREGGDRSLAEIARTHALTTMRDHVRDDGSTFHVVDYDPETGEILSRGTVQGRADDSTWARGQAWGLHGFAVAYRETGDPLFLETSRRLADAFLERLPPDGVPFWDLDLPDDAHEPKDSSAAAIAASGLLKLASAVRDTAEARRYRAASRSLVGRLSTPEYLDAGIEAPALLLHATGHRQRRQELDVPIIYADYYFLEALGQGLEARDEAVRPPVSP